MTPPIHSYEGEPEDLAIGDVRWVGVVELGGNAPRVDGDPVPEHIVHVDQHGRCVGHAERERACAAEQKELTAFVLGQGRSLVEEFSLSQAASDLQRLFGAAGDQVAGRAACIDIRLATVVFDQLPRMGTEADGLAPGYTHGVIRGQLGEHVRQRVVHEPLLGDDIRAAGACPRVLAVYQRTVVVLHAAGEHVRGRVAVRVRQERHGFVVAFAQKVRIEVGGELGGTCIDLAIPVGVIDGLQEVRIPASHIRVVEDAVVQVVVEETETEHLRVLVGEQLR